MNPDTKALITQVQTLADELALAMRSQPDFVNEWLADQAERLARVYREWHDSKVRRAK